jgi:hypothetical protein
MNDLSSGEITNLLANDANKIEIVHYCFNYLWVCDKKNRIDSYTETSFVHVIISEDR